ncbi:GGDEF/HD domain-containing protein [Planococcus antarcticus DSM 14505]|uniref:GGDEF domain-containing protein n=1 Tax=Planococcus antarcticus DSM 14505 TaxID=1185653 RepID=A0A1C7DHQ2_9BACL|nr:diguanylate cyclase [Planococcus antarcticus]ANU10964.1 GGDEF domain-containing protein [Planococcus antarcticus DSM 14505]EIM07116.1 GGDEF/HD domain-containing protein [Planococcus antarcticus DSM 14505]
MNSLLFFFLENMALIIALLYLALKVKEVLFPDLTESKMLVALSVLFVSFMTFSVMYNPFFYNGMRLDLREVPLYFISFVGGWKVGVLSAIFPSFYRFSFGGPTVIEGILQTIIFPVILGSLFRDKKTANKFFTLLDVKRMMVGWLIFELLKSVWMLTTTPATLFITITMAVFAGIAVLSMGLIANGENHHILLRKELESFSNQDPLTQLPNMRYFRNKVQTLVAQHVPVSIVMLDVDYFKSYNDHHGHQKGDVVLRSIGQLMQDNTRNKDYVARYGGEEFIFCITDPSDNSEAMAIAEKVRIGIEQHHFDGEELQPEGKLTVSMGVSLDSYHKSLDQLIDEADQALYQSKRSGRNQVSAFAATEDREVLKAQA